jgi:hypothetical protein
VRASTRTAASSPPRTGSPRTPSASPWTPVRAGLAAGVPEIPPEAYEERENGAEADAVAHALAAADMSRQAMLIARRIGHRYYEATALGNLAEGLAFAGRPEEALELGVTVSAGVATTAEDDPLEQADRWLYAAKHGGRNRVVAAPMSTVDLFARRTD